MISIKKQHVLFFKNRVLDGTVSHILKKLPIALSNIQ